MDTRQYGSRKQIILSDGASPIDPTNTTPDPRAVSIARAHAWIEAMESGLFSNLSELAGVLGVDESLIRRQVSLLFGSPIDFEKTLIDLH